ncbi:RNA polymerase III RPC4-domain-containing protein [Aspergillus varians]
MPPKAAPRRGASSAPARNNNGGEPGSNATPNTSASPAPPTSTTTTPGATTTTRAPVQRLQSLKKRTPSGSIGPGPGPASIGPGGGEPAKPTLKYKPRAVGRRSKEEREAIERLEAERNAERLAEAAAIQRGKANLAARGRAGFLGRGGRGGPMGMAGVAGPLGSGFAARRGRGGSRFGGGGGGDSRGTSMSRRSKSMTTGGVGGGSVSVSSDESDGEIRVSIDRINLESDADDDDDDDAILDQKKKKERKGKIALGSAREKGLRPIRVERHEHEDRVISVNMESSTAKSAELRQQAKGKAKDDDALFVQDDEETPVKQEPTDDQAMMDVPNADDHVTTDDGLLPAPKVKVRRKLGSREPSVPAVKDPKSLLQTKEDIEEYDRHVEDLELIKDLFTKEPPTKPNEATEGADVTSDEENKEKEKTEEGEAEEEPQNDKLTGHLFLMQFPPMTPNLIEPNADGTNTDPEATLIPIPAGSQGAGQNEATNGGQPEIPAVKREDDVEVLDGLDESTETRTQSKVVTAADWQLKAGQAGKLNVHASGRVTMDWGGISFELDRATAVDFLQEALIVSTPPNVTEEMVDDEHKVWAMGQLSGKFTVTPDWGRIL